MARAALNATFRSCAILALLAVLPACERDRELKVRRSGSERGAAIVSFAGGAITAEELRERFGDMSPQVRASYEGLEKRKEFVEGLARFELLAAEAFARGLDRDPQVQELTKKAMVERLLNEEFPAERTEVPESDVAAFYESHRAEFVKPATVQLSLVLLRAAPNSPSKADVKANAFVLLEKARSMPKLDLGAFERLAQESGDRRTDVLHVEIGPLGYDDLSRKYGAAIAKAATGLATFGDLSEVVETPEGFHILKLQARQGELSLSLEQARAQIRARLARERRSADFNRFVDSLKRRARYSLDEHALEGMALDLSSPPVPSQRPPPGYIAGAPLD